MSPYVRRTSSRDASRYSGNVAKSRADELRVAAAGRVLVGERLDDRLDVPGAREVVVHDLLVRDVQEQEQRRRGPAGPVLPGRAVEEDRSSLLRGHATEQAGVGGTGRSPAARSRGSGRSTVRGRDRRPARARRASGRASSSSIWTGLPSSLSPITSATTWRAPGGNRSGADVRSPLGSQVVDGPDAERGDGLGVGARRSGRAPSSGRRARSGRGRRCG